MNGIDYSWARPGGAAIRAAGFDFVVRYVPYPGDTGKGLDVAELVDLRANGLAVGLVFESTANRAAEGFGAGVADALTVARAVAALGFPADRPVYFAVDFDAQPPQFAAIDDYLRGAASQLGAARVGVYGSFGVMAHCQSVGSARWFWQTYAWSKGDTFPGRHLYQYLNGQTLNGGAVDYNEAYGEDAGLWMPEKEDGMTAEQLARLDRLERVLGGEDALADWDTRGAVLLPGYAAEQVKLGTLTARVDGHIANHAAGVSGPVAEHTHIEGKVKR